MDLLLYSLPIMPPKKPAHRTNNVLAMVGKPLYWALIVPCIFVIFTAVQTSETIADFFYSVGRATLSVLRRFSHAAEAVDQSRPTQWFKHNAIFLLALVIFIGMMSGGGYLFYLKILKDLPTPADLTSHKPIVTTRIYDRNHTLLYKIYKDQNRSLVPLSELPKSFIDATISIEDKDFYKHKGFSVSGIGRSINIVLTQGKIAGGGSTITQQLVKNVLLSPERTIERKIKEIILSMQVEATLSKDRILEMYVNEVSYGGSIYGIEAASETYFHKPARDLDLAQSAYLAGLPAAPSVYSPVGSNPDRALERQHEVLQRMVEDGKISALEAETAREEPISVTTSLTDIQAPHFVMYVRDLLAKEYGEDLVSQGGLEVTTSLDLPLQQQEEQIVRSEVDNLKSLQVSNGAALVTNPHTGEILAMVGSRDYYDTKHDGQVNVTLRPRQPGSSIKPLMYSAALENGFTPATMLDDSPITYSVPGSPPYTPRNYDGTYHGREPLRFALASSHNVPAVKTEAAIGLDAFIQQARAMGITTWDDTSRFGLSLTLGAGEVLMTDMATAYGVFANQGQRVDLNPILEVKAMDGKVLYENPCRESAEVCGGQPVLDPRVAYQITNILSDNNARSRAFGTHSVLYIPGQEVAVKTGTTNSLRDNWTIGFVQNRLVATWVGNNDNTPMSRVTSGITGASPIWNKIMLTMLNPDNPNHFPVPEGLATLSMCGPSGAPSCGGCGGEYTEYFLPENEPALDCNLAAQIATASATVAPSSAPAAAVPPTPPSTDTPNYTYYQAQNRILDGATTQQ